MSSTNTAEKGSTGWISVCGTAMVVLGTYWILKANHLVSTEILTMVWPVFMIACGMYCIIGRFIRKRRQAKGQSSQG